MKFFLDDHHQITQTLYESPPQDHDQQSKNKKNKKKEGHNKYTMTK